MKALKLKIAGGTAALAAVIGGGAAIAANQLSPTDALYVAAAFVRTGQPERGFQMLERATEQNAWLWFYMTSPLFDGVRSHPRFVRVSDRAKPPGV